MEVGFTATGPHTKLITQVEASGVSPIGDALYYALQASGIEDMDALPRVGVIRIHWEEVYGRDALRKMTINVYKGDE